MRKPKPGTKPDLMRAGTPPGNMSTGVSGDAPTCSRLAQGLILLAFGLAFCGMVIFSARTTSATYDETVHIPAGYSYWRWQDYRINPEHPPLLKMLAALPCLGRSVWPQAVEPPPADPGAGPVLDGEKHIRQVWARASTDTEVQWDWGHDLLFGVRAGTLQRLNTRDPAINSDSAIPPTELLGKDDFQNDPDRLLFAGRMVILLLGVGLGALVFLWARELFGFAGGVLSLALFCFDPNFIAHSGLVTTDVGISFFLFGALYFLWRLCRRSTWGNTVLFLLFFGLAFTAKFSAVLLLPMFWLAVAAWVVSPGPAAASPRAPGKPASLISRAAIMGSLFALALLVAWGLIWGAYAFRYTAVNDRGTSSLTALDGTKPLPIQEVVRRAAGIRQLLRRHPHGEFSENDLAKVDQLPVQPDLKGRGILFAQQHRLLPEAFLYCFAYGDMRSLARQSYLFGKLSNVGFPAYFLVAFLLKTPLPALAAIFAGLVLTLRRRGVWASQTAFLLAPVAVYVAASLATHINIGHRHLLPVYPFLYVLAGGLAVGWRRLSPAVKTSTAISALLLLVAASQVAFYPLTGFSGRPWRPWQVVTPHYLAYFNELAGGPAHGREALVDSNLDWGQDLKGLKEWLQEKEVKEPIYFCYFGTADPRFYQIAHHNLPGGYKFEPMEVGSLPPGSLVAVSATAWAGAYLSSSEWQNLTNILAGAELVDTVGYSIFIYREVHPKPDNADAHYSLGDALLKQGQVDEAMHQYRAALLLQPDHPYAHYNLGAGLLNKGQIDEAIRHFQAAVHAKPDYAEAYYNLGTALLLNKGDITEVIRHFQAAIRLKPDYAEAHNNLGSALLQNGQVDEAIRCFQAALRLEPDFPGASNNLAYAREMKSTAPQP